MGTADIVGIRAVIVSGEQHVQSIGGIDFQVYPGRVGIVGQLVTPYIIIYVAF